MRSKYIYTDSNTHTPCRTRKLALAFLIAQNGGEVTKDGVRIAWVSQGYLYEASRDHKGTDAYKITPEMRKAAQGEISALVPEQKFLAISYDPDQQQWFYDQVVAKSKDQAIRAVLAVRAYCIDADAVSSDGLRGIFEHLLHSTVRSIQHNWREIIRAHRESVG